MTTVRRITIQSVGTPRTWAFPAGDVIGVTVAPAETQIVAIIAPQGPIGEPGKGIPAGGVAGQLLAKAGQEDFETQWVDVDFSAIAPTIDGGNF